jgi:uncharacterized protein YyaL (SSP411 family)
LIELYEATFDRRWLDLALAITETQIALFADPAGGFFSTSGRDASVLIRMKDDYDGAEPSGNSVAAVNLIKLAELYGREDLRARAEGTVRAFAGKLRESPHGMPLLLVAYGMLVDAPADVVIVAEKDQPGLAEIQRALEARFVPNRVQQLADRSAREHAPPWIAAMTAIDGKPTIYVCRDRACERPTTDVGELARLLPARTIRIE